MKAYRKLFTFRFFMPVTLALTMFMSAAFINSDKAASQILEKVSKNYKSYKQSKPPLKSKYSTSRIKLPNLRKALYM